MATYSGRSYVGDIGTVLMVNTKEDISTASKVSLKIKKPDDTEVEWIGTVDRTTYIRYATVSGDFDQSGEYHMNAYVEMTGWTGRGETVSFHIYEPFQE